MNNMPCPICGRPVPENFREFPDFPFCSKRCRTIDLGRWLVEGYRIAGEDQEDRSTAGESE
jgi:endogenous inhibitor of DNA gyrase (YacG/DUF329 family)